MELQQNTINLNVFEIVIKQVKQGSCTVKFIRPSASKFMHLAAAATGILLAAGLAPVVAADQVPPQRTEAGLSGDRSSKQGGDSAIITEQSQDERDVSVPLRGQGAQTGAPSAVAPPQTASGEPSNGRSGAQSRGDAPVFTDRSTDARDLAVRPGDRSGRGSNTQGSGFSRPATGSGRETEQSGFEGSAQAPVFSGDDRSRSTDSRDFAVRPGERPVAGGRPNGRGVNGSQSADGSAPDTAQSGPSVGDQGPALPGNDGAAPESVQSAPAGGAQVPAVPGNDDVSADPRNNAARPGVIKDAEQTHTP